MAEPNVTIIAHRGARGCAPENTLVAFELAARQGADAVELDVQLAADGRPVVVHDDDLLRCTDARRRHPERRPWQVAGFTSIELAALDAGTWFVDELGRPAAERQAFLRSLSAEEIGAWIGAAELARYGSGAIGVPGLADCLAACRRLGLEVHLELKAMPRRWPGLAARTVEEVVAAGMERSVVISSFDHQQLVAVRELSPVLRTAVLSRDRLAKPAAYLARLGAQAYHPGCVGDCDAIGFGAVAGGLDRATIAEVRAAGYAVNVWTENEPERMRALLAAGVSGIFTDYPHRLAALVGRRPRRPA